MQKEKAIIVEVNTGIPKPFDSITELRNLAEACDIEVLDILTQNLNKINVSFYIGTGKVVELNEMVQKNDATSVIFDDELSPIQIRNLEEQLDCRVIDRTVLILDIFERRAKTKEAKLQVEIAKLQYMLPRLVGSNEQLGRQVGGVGVYNKGSGEKKIELDRRGIRQRIKVLNQELQDLVSKRRTQRKQRKKNQIPTVALVGYTNAGKSTVMNFILSRFNENADEMFEKDMLFATLETTVRQVKFPDNKSILLTDTVGFISQLPHHLVKAFRSTLEEVIEADLLLHVVDCANVEYENQIEVTRNTLKDLGADSIETLMIYNKVDISEVEQDENNMYVSAKTGEGIDALLDRVKELVFTDYVQCQMLIPYTKSEIVSHFLTHANVQSTDYQEGGTMLTLECKNSDYLKYQEFEVK